MKSIPQKVAHFFQKQPCLTVIRLSFFLAGLFLFFRVSSLQAENSNSLSPSIVRYQELIKNGEADFKACMDLAALYKEQGLYQKSIEVLERFLSSAGGKKEKDNARFFLGRIYFLQGNTDKALDLFKKLSRSRQKDWLLSLYLGLAYESKNNLLLAEKNYKKSLSLNKNSISFYRLAKINFSRHKYSKAADYFSKTIEFDSSIRTAYVYLGESLFKSGEYEQAYNFTAKALNFYPEDKKVRDNLAKVKKKLGKKFFAKKKEHLAKKRKEKKFEAYTPSSGEVPLVKVRIIDNAGQFTLKCGGDFIFQGKKNGLKARKNKFYTVINKGGNTAEILDQRSGKKLCRLGLPLSIKSKNQPFYILDVTTGKGDFWQKKIDSAYKGMLNVSAGMDGLTVINELDLETYLYGVISAEILSTSPPEALKAQSVAARTISMRNRGRHKKEGFDFCNTTHCQVYRGLTVETSATTRAVDETRGEVMFYKGEPIEAFYHANCGGCLRRDLYGSPPYLYSDKRDFRKEDWDPSPWGQEQWFKQNEDSYCSPSRRNNYRWQRVYDADDFMLDFGFPLSSVKKFFTVVKGDCGHIQELTVTTGKGVHHIEKDLNIRNFLGNLKSSACKLELRFRETKKGRKPDLLFIWGAGFGHGLGMCQEGTISQAEQGYSYQDILKHYYKDIEIKKAY